MHITEALGGGVLNIIQQLSEHQSKSGNKVTIIYSERADTPPSKTLRNLFFPTINLIKVPMVTSISPIQDTISLWKLLKAIRVEDPEVIHLHSSKAGVLGRLAARLTSRQKHCFYTPHGFSFLRQDISASKRYLLQLIERFSSLLGTTTIACSESELQHSINGAFQKRSILVENSIPLHLVQKSSGSTGTSCLISTSGRLCFAKKPSAFRDLAISLQDTPARFQWIGGGELESDLFIDGTMPSNISLTGWVTREQVTGHLQTSDLFVMTSLWEGMPLSLLEAQASGLASIVPNVEGCRDVVIDGVTGFICESMSEMSEKTRLLIDDTKLRVRMGIAAREAALRRFSPDRMHTEMMSAYKHLKI